MFGGINTSRLINSRNGNVDGDSNSNSNSSNNDANDDTRMLESTKNLLGVDKKGNQRALFLYDGGCGV